MMKKVYLIIFCAFIFLGCNRPSWHKTTQGYYVYCVANDKYNLEWNGETAGILVNGQGSLVSYNKDGKIKSEDSFTANLGVAQGWNYMSCYGYQYLGEMDDDEPNGFGVKIVSDTIQIGNFKDSRIHNGLCYMYQIRNGNIWPCFEGSFKKGKRKGFGKEYKDSLLAYEGSYKKNLRDGLGKSYNKGILSYDGEWSKGEKNGIGTLYNDNGLIIYKGEWKNGLYDGIGTLYKNGKCIEGKWDEGTLKKSISTSVIKEIGHATKIWLNKDSSINDTCVIESGPVLAQTQMEFIGQLQNDIKEYLEQEFSKRIDKRFGFWNLLRMLIQPWITSDVKRAKKAEQYFCKTVPSKDIQQLINSKIDYYNENVAATEKLNYVTLGKMPAGCIVDSNAALKIFDREALETTDTLAGILIDILFCIVIAFIIGFIIGLFCPALIPFVGVVDIIISIIALLIGLYVSIFRTSAVSINLEKQILNLLTDNYIQFLDSQNIIFQMLGLQ